MFLVPVKGRATNQGTTGINTKAILLNFALKHCHKIVKGRKFSKDQLLLPLFNVKQGVVLGGILCKDMLMLRE